MKRSWNEVFIRRLRWLNLKQIRCYSLLVFYSRCFQLPSGHQILGPWLLGDGGATARDSGHPGSAAEVLVAVYYVISYIHDSKYTWSHICLHIHDLITYLHVNTYTYTILYIYRHDLIICIFRYDHSWETRTAGTMCSFPFERNSMKHLKTLQPSRCHILRTIMGSHDRQRSRVSEQIEELVGKPREPTWDSGNNRNIWPSGVGCNKACSIFVWKLKPVGSYMCVSLNGGTPKTPQNDHF